MAICLRRNSSTGRKWLPNAGVGDKSGDKNEANPPVRARDDAAIWYRELWSRLPFRRSMVRRRYTPYPQETKYRIVKLKGETLMACNLQFFCLGAMLWTAVAAAQVASTPPAHPPEPKDSTAPVAYVYVSAVNP